MTPRITSCLLGLPGVLAPAALSAQQTLRLVNGDRLTGALVRVEGASWIFRATGGALTLPAAQVAAFTAPEPIGIRLADGTILAARVAPAPGGDTLVLATSDGSTRGARPSDFAAVGRPDRLDALRPVRVLFLRPITRFWTARGSLGVSDKRGNSRARGLTLEIDLERKTVRDRLNFGAGFVREDAQPPGGSFQRTVARSYASGRLDVFLSGRPFTFGSVRLERDRFQDLALRGTYTAGVGYQAVASPKIDLRVNLLGGVRRERFVSNDSAAAVPILGAGFAYQHRFGPAVFASKADWTPNAREIRDYLFRAATSLATKVYRGLGLRVEALDDYNNRPRPGIKRNDLLVRTTVTYSIGR